MASVISETEQAVLKVLWDLALDRCEVHSVLQEQGRQWAYTTVQTLLNRLQSKGYAASKKNDGPAHVYRAAVSREQLLQRRLHDLADEYCEGTASPLVLALVEGGDFTPAEIERFRELLDQLESDRSRKKGR